MSGSRNRFTSGGLGNSAMRLLSGAIAVTAVLALLGLTPPAWTRPGSIRRVPKRDAAAAPRYLHDRVVVQYTASEPLGALLASRGSAVLASRRLPRAGRLGTIRVPARTDVRRWARRVARLPGVRQVSLDYVFHADATPNDPLFGEQYALRRTRATAAWDVDKSEGRATVAVVDTGVDDDHVDLASNLLAGRNFVMTAIDRTYANDDFGHGTHVAGIIAAVTDNATGVAGLSWNGRILPVKVLDQDGIGDLFGILSGMLWAADNGARVVNLSLGADIGYSPVFQDVIDYLHTKGVVVVASAGNSPGSIEVPAQLDHVVAVGSTDASDNISSFSSTGTFVDMAAPGEDVLSTMPNHLVTLTDPSQMDLDVLPQDYGRLSGTSMAAAYVSGMAALILSRNPTLTPDEVETIIEGSADDLGPAGRDERYGWGRLNAEQALAATSSGATDATPLSVRITQPESTCVTATFTATAEVSVTGAGVSQVSFYLDGHHVLDDTSLPYQADISTSAWSGAWRRIQAVATDSLSRSASDIRFYYFDNRPPDVTFSEPGPDFSARAGALVFSSVDDDSGRVSMEAFISQNGGRFWDPLPRTSVWWSSGPPVFQLESWTPEGPALIKVVGTDPVGHETSLVHSGQIDNTPPSLALDPPRVGFSRFRPVRLTGRTEPGVDVFAESGWANRTTKFRTALDASGGVTITARLHREGATLIGVVAEDRAGNFASKRAIRYFDYHAPRLLDWSPKAAQLAPGSRITITYRVRDNVFHRVHNSVSVYRVVRRRTSPGTTRVVHDWVRSIRGAFRAGTISAVWDGTDAHGRAVPGGEYRFVVSLKDSCGNSSRSGYLGTLWVR